MNPCKRANDSVIVELETTMIMTLKSSFPESRVESVEEFEIDFC